MTTTTNEPAAHDAAATGEAVGSGLDERVLEATAGALELFGIYLGDRLGLYDVLRRTGPVTPGDLAEQAGIAERYAREWLEQQAVAGVLTVEDEGAAAAELRFTLPAAHVGVLADPVHADHLAPLARMVVGIAGVLDEVVAAYRSGAGVSFARYGPELREGQGAINRPAFSTSLVEEWLPAAGDLVDRLAVGGRVADLGCGVGWSTLGVARAFPTAEVIGLDTDVASIEQARARAAEHGIAARFEAADASELATHGPFDAVLVLEALHDMARPDEVLAAARAALAPGGAVIVADEAVAERFTAPGDLIERLMYGWSISHCLPAAMAEQPSEAIGTVIREGTVRELALAAGFATCDVLPVDGGFFRIYRLAG